MDGASRWTVVPVNRDVKYAAVKPEHRSGQTEITMFQHVGQVLVSICPTRDSALHIIFRNLQGLKQCRWEFPSYNWWDALKSW